MEFNPAVRSDFIQGDAGRLCVSAAERMARRSGRKFPCERDSEGGGHSISVSVSEEEVPNSLPCSGWELLCKS
jgi:hypothetical protein